MELSFFKFLFFSCTVPGHSIRGFFLMLFPAASFSSCWQQVVKLIFYIISPIIRKEQLMIYTVHTRFLVDVLVIGIRLNSSSVEIPSCFGFAAVSSLGISSSDSSIRNRFLVLYSTFAKILIAELGPIVCSQ